MQPNLQKNDILWLIRKLTFDLFQLKITKMFLIITSVSIILLTIIQTFLFLKKFNGYYFIMYSAVYTGSLFILVSSLSVLPISKLIKTAWVKFSFWEINSATPKIERKIRKEIFYINCVVFFNTIVAIISGIFHAIPLQDDEELFYPLAIFETYTPEWKDWFSGIYRASFLPMPIIMVAPAYTVVYLCAHMRFQFCLLLHFLENINPDNENISDKKYQAQIKERLHFCIKRHIHLFSKSRPVLEDLKKFVFVLTLCGTIFCISIIIFHFSFQGTYEGRYPRIITIIIAASITFFLSILPGQLIENTSSEIFEVLRNTNWVSWNEQNKKLFIILLLNTRQIYKIKITENVSLNYELGVTMAKAMYSMISVMKQL
ncbi:odorant receptor 292 [Tribolium castaneum]|uniref:Odorant receptor n=1 Tax=Tribolium castaneum TaxID=7070 RepID=D6WEV0_TRICA|nr:odorant receptor 292 [Tribolium castaneum]